MPPVRANRRSYLPGVLEALQKRQQLTRSKQLSVWLLLNIVVASLVLADVLLYEYSIASTLDALTNYDEHVVVQWCEVVLLCAAAVNAMLLVLMILSPLLASNPALTAMEKKLLGFKYRDHPILTNRVTATVIKVSTKCLNFDWLFNLKPHPPTAIHQSTTCPAGFATAQHSTTADVFHDASPNFSRAQDHAQQSAYYSPAAQQAYTPGATPDVSFNISSSTVSSYPSPNQSDLYLDSSMTQINRQTPQQYSQYDRPPSFAEMLLRLRRARSCSPMIEKIANKKQLLRYLDDFERSHAAANSTYHSLYSQNLDSSLGAADFTYGFGSRKFEPGVVPPKAATLLDDFMDTSLDSSAQNIIKSGAPSFASTANKSASNVSFSLLNTSVQSNPAQSMWVRFDVDENKLDIYCQNLRCWIATTILRPLVRQIDLINQFLTGQSRTDLCIGVGSLVTLQHSAQTNPALKKQLDPLVPYLELSNSQPYLVDRIRQLSSDACITPFKYDSGGMEKLSNKSVAWSDHLPSDAQLVWHCLCSYLDAQLPPHPQSSKQDQPFSSIYTLQAATNPTVIQTAKNGLYFVVQSGATCCMQVVFDGQVLQVQQGRNNLWHSVLLFLAILRSQFDERLGQISLGPAALNMLHIFSDN